MVSVMMGCAGVGFVCAAHSLEGPTAVIVYLGALGLTVVSSAQSPSVGSRAPDVACVLMV